MSRLDELRTATEDASRRLAFTTGQLLVAAHVLANAVRRGHTPDAHALKLLVQDSDAQLAAQAALHAAQEAQQTATDAGMARAAEG